MEKTIFMAKTKKEIQLERMIRYFVEAAWNIEDSEGPEAVTARKVADLAGYNVATLYNYFDDLDHLLTFASLRHLRDYALALPKYAEGIDDPLILYMKTWECFNYYSFQKPLMYKRMFFGKFAERYNSSLKLYYDIFPEQLPKDGLHFYPMLQETELHKRDYACLLASAEAGYVPLDKIKTISDMNVLIYRGMLDRLIGQEQFSDYSLEETARRVTDYHARTLISFGVDKKLLESFLIDSEL